MKLIKGLDKSPLEQLLFESFIIYKNLLECLITLKEIKFFIG